MVGELTYKSSYTFRPLGDDDAQWVETARQAKERLKEAKELHNEFVDMMAMMDMKTWTWLIYLEPMAFEHDL